MASALLVFCALCMAIAAPVAPAGLAPLGDRSGEPAPRWESDAVPRGREPMMSSGSLAAMTGSAQGGSPLEWLVFVEAVVFLFVLELSVLQKLTRGVASHCALVLFWICMGMFYNTCIWLTRGREQALYWFSGYCLELMLSVDNLLAFSMIFRAYRTPRHLMHRALLVGVAGSLVLRLALFSALGHEMHVHWWCRVGLGLLLMCSGAAALGEEQDDAADTVGVRLLKKCLGSRLDDCYDAQEHLVTVRDGKMRVTLLAFVVLCLLVVDLVFALDSVSAKVAAIPGLFNAFTSTVASTFALRAMFFVLNHLLDALEGMQYGISFVITFIGVRLVLGKWLYLPAWCVSVVACVAFALSMAYSLAVALGKARHARPGAARLSPDTGGRRSPIDSDRC
jgi:tellurite resistance protein TerC